MGAGYENIMETLSLLGIADTGDKAVGKFSLGMKQRLALARAMLTKPDLLILDEPINGLDPRGIIEVRELLLRINHEYHTSILISSHILDELSKIADTIGIIDHGAISFVTFSIGNILAQTITTISAILLGLLPLYVGMIKKSTIATVVLSIIIVAIASNSQGSSAGLMSIPVAALIFGIIGVVLSAIAMRKMILSDLSN